jgi:hypothetical protein
MYAPRRATITLNGWQGLTTQEVEVVGQTPQRYRIRAITRTRLAGRLRYLEAGHTVLVPRKVVNFLDIPALEVAP